MHSRGGRECPAHESTSVDSTCGRRTRCWAAGTRKRPRMASTMCSRECTRSAPTSRSRTDDHEDKSEIRGYRHLPGADVWVQPARSRPERSDLRSLVLEDPGPFQLAAN